jgi:hypothetical protein
MPRVSYGYKNLCYVKTITPMCSNNTWLVGYKLKKLQVQSLDL